MTDRDTIRNRLLAVIATLLVIAALRASYPITMPVALAALIVAAAWPIRCWLNRIFPPPLGYVGTILLLVAILTAFCAAIYLALAQTVEAFVKNQDRFAHIYGSFAAYLERVGVPDPGGQEGYARLVDLGQAFVSSAYTALGYIGFIAVLVMLGLPEVPAFRRKVAAQLDRPESREVLETIDEIAAKVRSYIGVSTLTSLMTGAAVAAWTWATGVELALVWGVLNFLLNYIPVIGNIIGIFPPTIYAMLQFGGWKWPLLEFVGLSAIQIAISNFVYPLLQGKSLSLSPVGILAALAFWSWVWGMAGALIAVPLTAAVVIVCQHFDSTRWIARLLSNE